MGRSKERYIREHFRKYTDPDLPPVWKTLEVISLGELSKLFNNFSESQLKHDVAHEFGLNHHKLLSSKLNFFDYLFQQTKFGTFIFLLYICSVKVSTITKEQ